MLTDADREALMRAWPWPSEAATTENGFADVADAVEAIVAAHVAAAKAAMWDEVAQALAWATENGSAPVRYVIDNNPYRATP